MQCLMAQAESKSSVARALFKGKSSGVPLLPRSLSDVVYLDMLKEFLMPILEQGVVRDKVIQQH